MKRVLEVALFLTLAWPAWTQQQRPAITGIAFVRVFTGHDAASADFYSKTLGFSSSKAGQLARYPVNDSQWIEVTPLRSLEPGPRLAAVGFTTRDAKGMQRYLEAHGVHLFESLHKGRFSVRDPEGNLIYFVQQTQGPAVAGEVPATATSRRIIHAGFIVKDVDLENEFYRDLLGFRPYWHGGRTEEKTDWMSFQVPDGSDWLEYMLNIPSLPTQRQYGVQDHFSLGVEHMSDAVAALARNHCEGADCAKTQLGRDGKVQLNLYDPDLTRVEFMEFQPAGKPCCSEFTAKHPTEHEDR
ncbi:MAG TPA: VOC family protein [Edaphobacter sp.]|nr:VOC family protein [Edaphobacter sp.]